MQARTKIFKSTYRYLLGASSIYGAHLLLSNRNAKNGYPDPFSDQNLIQHDAPMMNHLLCDEIFPEMDKKENLSLEEENITVRYPSGFFICLTKKILADLRIHVNAPLFQSRILNRPSRLSEGRLTLDNIFEFINFCSHYFIWEDGYELTIKNYENFLNLVEKHAKGLNSPYFNPEFIGAITELLYRLNPREFQCDVVTSQELSFFFERNIGDSKIKPFHLFKNLDSGDKNFENYDLQLPHDEKICSKLELNNIPYNVVRLNEDESYVSVRWTHYKTLSLAVKMMLHKTLPFSFMPRNYLFFTNKPREQSVAPWVANRIQLANDQMKPC
ncbi:MAG: hypothetical protein SFW66_01920 [Gammaproteobacteria bacterium]|nr:hypothetical protein [Gammaproteobacteria bacterium]